MKINIGSSFKSYKHKAHITNNTTTNFGSVQPIFCRKLHAGDSISLNIGQFVRLMPMPYPTLGEIGLKTKAVFVPMGDIALPYDNYLSQTNYQFAQGAAIPTNLPALSMSSLMTYFLNQSRYAFSKSYTYTPVPIPPQDAIADKPLGGSDVSYEYANLIPDTPVYQDDLLKDMYKQIGILDYTGVYSSEEHANGGMTDLVASDITPQNADFLTFVKTDGSISSFATSTQSGSANRVVCYRLTQDGYNVVRALRSLGYSLNSNDSTPVNVMPIIAYAKALFDSFGIQRDMSYTDSNLYVAIKSISEMSTFWTGTNPPTLTTFVALILGYIADFSWCTLPTDFVSAHMVSPYGLGSTREQIPDIYPSTDDALQTNVGTIPAYPAIGQNQTQPALVLNGGSINQIQLNLLQRLTSIFAQDSIIGRNIKRYLQQRYGAQISNQIYSEVYDCGQAHTPIQISDLYSTSDTLTATGGSQLGSFAGKGAGSGSGKFGVSKVRTDGYFIVFQWIEPNESYFQGMATELYYVNSCDEARPEYDALGYEATRFGAIADLNDVNATNFDPTKTFGFIPRYSGWKNYKSVINGDLRLRRYGSDMQCFYLDQFRKQYDQIWDPSNSSLQTAQNVIPPAGDGWRFFGKYPYLQCFNRIFYNSQEYGDMPYSYTAYQDMTSDHIPDNFIIHNIIDIVETNHLKPLSNSYDTFIDGINNSSHDVSQS